MEVDGFLEFEYVVGVMKMGNIVPRAGIELTTLAFRASGKCGNHNTT